jgi:two-component system cell cycle response regulator
VLADEARPSRILVVDDSRVVRAVVASHLKRAGYEVDEAEDGRAALGLLQRGSYDVVVTDVKMPEADGFFVLSEVRRLVPTIEVVILTGTHAQDANAAIRALRLGVHDYLPKTSGSGDEIVRTIDRALLKKRQREAHQRLLAELWTLGHTDVVTGVSNRRAFDLALKREVARAQRYSQELSLALLDLDHFKVINDTHGHVIGDTILRSVAETVGWQLRDGDSLYRFGGEEFATLLPATTLAGAMRVAERIVTAVSAAPLAAGPGNIRVTISVGVASMGRQGLPELVACADAALYQAKSAGRNRASDGGLATAATSRT